jgi:hypothetical protein
MDALEPLGCSRIERPFSEEYVGTHQNDHVQSLSTVKMSQITSVLTSDILIACILPIVVLALSSKLSHLLSWPEFLDLIHFHTRTMPEQFSLQRAYQSYSCYQQYSRNELSSMRASYSTLGRAQKRIGYSLGYPKKLDRLQELTNVNGKIAQSICKLAEVEFKDELILGRRWFLGSQDVNVGRVRESFRHFVRDWSEEGKEEREQVFTPILKVLLDVDPDERSVKNVLVPGSGLGRLAWEISQLGSSLSVCYE